MTLFSIHAFDEDNNDNNTNNDMKSDDFLQKAVTEIAMESKSLY